MNVGDAGSKIRGKCKALRFEGLQELKILVKFLNCVVDGTEVPVMNAPRRMIQLLDPLGGFPD